MGKMPDMGAGANYGAVINNGGIVYEKGQCCDVWNDTTDVGENR
jgi:hypothetical protein